MTLRIEYWLPAAWGLVVLASWIGWGSVVVAALKLKRFGRMDWALRAAWGMCVTIFVGGVSVAAGFSSTNVMGALALVGAGAWLLFFVDGVKRGRGRQLLVNAFSPPRIVWYAPAILFGAFLYLGSIEASRFNVNDDLSSYMVFTQRMMDAGTLEEPMSWRRLSTYGGQQYLQGQTLVAGSNFNFNILELGLMPIVLAGLVYGLIRPRTRSGHILAGVVVLAVLACPVPRVNAQSHCSGVVGFVALLRTMMLRRPVSEAGWRGMIPAGLLGLVAAGVSTLRMNYLPGIVAAIGISLAVDFVRLPAERKRTIGRKLVTFAVMAAALLPWAISLYASSGSLYFPAMRGNFRPEFQILDRGLPAGESLQWILQCMIFLPTLLLLIPAVLMFRRKLMATAVALYVSAIGCSAAMAWVFTTSDRFNIYRYNYAMLFAAAIGVIAWTLRRRFRIASPAAAGMVIVIAIGGIAWEGGANVKWYAKDFRNSMRNLSMDYGHSGNDLSLFLDPRFRHVENYREAQSDIPRGRAFLAITNCPLLFDYARNPIFNIDHPGAASPPPGMPMNDPAALAAYLKKLGIEYVIYSDWDTALMQYSRKFNRGVVESPEKHTPTDRIIAPRMLEFMTEIDALAASAPQERFLRRGSLRVIVLK